ncbi:hypothetical protein Trydic_g7209 [Trypoxylus dichotomus]
MGNRYAHPHKETPGIPEPDTAEGPQRSLVRNTTIQEDAGVEPPINFIRRITTRFFNRAVDHWNSLMSESEEYDPTIPWRDNPPNTNSKIIKRRTGTLVVKRGETTYTKLLKNIKDNLKFGVQIISIRKTAKADLLFEVKGGPAKAMEETVRRTVGRRSVELVRVKAMRPTRGGNQVATIHASRALAKTLFDAKIKKIRWVSCKLRERVNITRCCKGMGLLYMAPRSTATYT